MFVVYVRRLNRLLEQLRDVARADVRAQVALVVRGVAHIRRQVQLARRAYANHHDARLAYQRAAPARVRLPAAAIVKPPKPAREQKAQVFIRRLRPPVEVVRKRQPVRVKRLHLARVDEVMLIPVRRVIGTRNRQARHARVIRSAQRIVRHRHILALVKEVIQRIARPPLVAQMHNRVHALEQARVLSSVGVYQVRDNHPLHLIAARIRVLHIHQNHLIALAERGQQLVGDIPRRPRHQNFLYSHIAFPFPVRFRSQLQRIPQVCVSGDIPENDISDGKPNPASRQYDTLSPLQSA